MNLIPRRVLESVANTLPARNIKHHERPYLRRFYLCTKFGVRYYLHHFVDSDPDGLHNHPWRFGGSVILTDYYNEERRWCRGQAARMLSLFNVVNGDTLHRVIVPPHLKAVVFDLDGGGYHNYRVGYPNLGVWTLFWHTEKVMPWATLKDKGAFVQYYEESPTYDLEEGHSIWWKTAPKGKELFNNDYEVSRKLNKEYKVML